MTVLVPDARRVMFAGLIDYAGLYPPMSLDVAGAVAGYRAARASDRAWVLGRFLCPASQLEELAGALIGSMASGEPAWPVSVTFDLEPGASASGASAFHAEMDPAASVHLAEARLLGGSSSESVASLYTTALSVNDTVVPFLEVSRDEAMPAAIEAIAAAVSETHRPGGAKLRCGGVTAAAFPTVHEVAEFIVECVDRGLPFKTTAGLHHPIRHHDDVLDVMRHGFVNLLAATAAARTGAGMSTVEAIVAETEPDAFEVSFGTVNWRGERLGTDAIADTRHESFIAYGSCEFDKPVDDLAELGMLP